MIKLFIYRMWVGPLISLTELFLGKKRDRSAIWEEPAKLEDTLFSNLGIDLKDYELEENEMDDIILKVKMSSSKKINWQNEAKFGKFRISELKKILNEELKKRFLKAEKIGFGDFCIRLQISRLENTIMANPKAIFLALLHLANEENLRIWEEKAELFISKI